MFCAQISKLRRGLNLARNQSNLFARQVKMRLNPRSKLGGQLAPVESAVVRRGPTEGGWPERNEDSSVLAFASSAQATNLFADLGRLGGQLLTLRGGSRRPLLLLAEEVHAFAPVDVRRSRPSLLGVASRHRRHRRRVGRLPVLRLEAAPVLGQVCLGQGCRRGAQLERRVARKTPYDAPCNIKREIP